MGIGSLAAAMVLVACAVAQQQAREDAQIGKAFVIKPGEILTVGGTGLRVGFEGVPQDSRCPTGVTCVWEGDAVVSLTLEKAPASKDARELHTSRRYARDTDYEGYVVRLQALAPHPREGQTIAADDYRATLLVERR